MPKTAVDEVFDEQGNVVSSTQRAVPDTKIEKALAWLNSNDPTAITTLAQAKPFIVAHHRILRALLIAFQQGLFDEPDDGTL